MKMVKPTKLYPGSGSWVLVGSGRFVNSNIAPTLLRARRFDFGNDEAFDVIKDVRVPFVDVAGCLPQ